MIHISLPLAIILTNQSHRFTSYQQSPSAFVCAIGNLYVYVPSIIYGVCFIEKCTLEFFSMYSSAYTLTQLYYYASSHYFPCILV